jgi:GDP-6-deoxy-D-talose 4-dehydrogenase
MKPVVLVTGITGFTGALMRTELESNGYHVAGTALFDPLPGDRVLDIESAASCKAVIAEVAPDYVIHLAGIAFVQSDPVKLYAANVVGTVNLLDALAGATHPVRKVVLASSANVYGNREGTLISEAEEARPANHYATSKLAMEKMAANYFERLPIIITRPFNYTGVGQSTDFLVPKIVSHFAKRAPSIELGNIDVERDFSDVEMVAKVYRKLIESQSRSLVVNICTGTATSLAQIIAMMEEIAGYRIEVRSNPAFIRSNDIRHLTGDPTAMIAAIGKLDARPIRAMLESMYRSFQ